MNKIVFENIELLDVYLNNQILISEGNELSLMGKDDYDTVEKLSSLEYPIYFTYHELLNIISYDNDLSYSKKIHYLEKIIETLDVLIQYIDDYNEENNRICFIIDNIYERYEKIKSQTMYKNPWSEKIVLFFDDLVDNFRTASKYLYYAPISYYPLMYLKPGETLEDEGDCDSDSDNDSVCDSDSDNDSVCDSDSVRDSDSDSDSDSDNDSVCDNNSGNDSEENGESGNEDASNKNKSIIDDPD
tara:strand:- start:104 stop:835 length:732 start_codon:yes stop_codon:yes gene_type:complete